MIKAPEKNDFLKNLLITELFLLLLFKYKQIKKIKMKKFFMLLAVAGFFSMTTISCGEKAAEGEATEEGAEGDHDHAEGEEEHAH